MSRFWLRHHCWWFYHNDWSDVCAIIADLPQEGTVAEQQAYQEALGESQTHFQQGVGCTFCAQTGYRGRVAVFELLVLDETLRRLVLRNASSDDMQEAALKAGMRTMLVDGMMKVRDGVTTPAEVMKNVFALN